MSRCTDLANVTINMDTTIMLSRQKYCGDADGAATTN
jgi:hypothetical protein